jgi:CRP-like cAMP-binding protein
MANLFENISSKNIDKLKKLLRASTIKYHRNVNVISNIYYRDEYIALIDKGAVQIIFTDYDGNKIVLEELKSGEMFGSLTSSVKQDEITCITKEDTQITFIEYNQITNDEIIKYDLYIIFIKNLIRILTEQLSNRNNRIELLTKKTTRDKLLTYFKIMAQKKGIKKFEMDTSLTEIANYLSVDRSAMSRELKYLKEEGFIEINNKKVKVNY